MESKITKGIMTTIKNRKELTVREYTRQLKSKYQAHLEEFIQEYESPKTSKRRKTRLFYDIERLEGKIKSLNAILLQFRLVEDLNF